jgi:Cohesin domain
MDSRFCGNDDTRFHYPKHYFVVHQLRSINNLFFAKKDMASDFLKLAACFVISFLFFASCKDNVKPPDLAVNPIDSTSSTYIAPKSFITGPNNTTLAVDSVTITWAGTQDVASFSYNVDGTGWSAFSGTTSILLTDLDEGAHTFGVRAKHKNGNLEITPPSISFNVSAVTGPAIMFFPRRKAVAVGTEFTVSVQAEKVSTNLLAAKISLQVQPSILQVDSVTVGDFMRQNGETPILFWSINTTKDTVTINVAAAGGAIAGVNGSGALANLYCHAKTTGLAMINFVAAQTAYRDTVGNAIPINMVIAGKVVAQ